MKKNTTKAKDKAHVYLPADTYNSFGALVVKFNKATGSKLTLVKAMTEALDFFSEIAMLPRDFKTYDTYKKLSSIDENVLKIKNQTLGFLKTFERDLLSKIQSNSKNNSDNMQDKYNISAEEILIYLYKKNRLIDDKIQILLWFFLKQFETSELPDQDIKTIFEEYKKRIKNAGSTKTKD
jgi:hypothetical protein